LIPRRLRNVVAVIAGALAAGVPVALIHHGVDAYIERQSEEEVRLAAQRAIAQAEWRIGQAIEALTAIGQARLNSCADVDARALRQAVLTTTPIKEIVVTDEAGSEHCAASGGTRAQPKMLSRELRTADDRIYLSVVGSSDFGGRALRVSWQRAGDALQLAATIPSDVFLIDGARSNTAGVPVVRIIFGEGTLIAAPVNALEGTADDGDTIGTHNQSSRYPLLATASVSRDAVFSVHNDLRTVSMAGAAVLALLTIVLALLLSSRARANPVAELERALEAGEFVPYYQPLVDLRTGAIVGAEVLMRWRKADGTIVAPAVFIPLAESSGLILDMTRALMIAVRDEFSAVLGRRPGVKVAFNLTARHFDDDKIIADVRDIFAASPIRMSQVVLEVTERQPLEDLLAARRVIAGLQDLGCKVAIDDVGTGHGGLSYMLKLAVNYIKIDKLFVDAIGTERYSATIIETLVDLARNMRIEVFAEGVETFEQVKFLRERGVYLCQGYVFAPPLAGPLFRQLLEAAQPLGAAGAAHDRTAPQIGAFMAARDRVTAA
jgi:sensor c-di-GMP phosphodiesterase-like protein